MQAAIPTHKTKNKPLKKSRERYFGKKAVLLGSPSFCCVPYRPGDLFNHTVSSNRRPTPGMSIVPRWNSLFSFLDGNLIIRSLLTDPCIPAALLCTHMCACVCARVLVGGLCSITLFIPAITWPPEWHVSGIRQKPGLVMDDLTFSFWPLKSLRWPGSSTTYWHTENYHGRESFGASDIVQTEPEDTDGASKVVTERLTGAQASISPCPSFLPSCFPPSFPSFLFFLKSLLLIYVRLGFLRSLKTSLHQERRCLWVRGNTIRKTQGGLLVY